MNYQSNQTGPWKAGRFVEDLWITLAPGGG